MASFSKNIDSDNLKPEIRSMSNRKTRNNKYNLRISKLPFALLIRYMASNFVRLAYRPDTDQPDGASTTEEFPLAA